MLRHDRARGGRLATRRSSRPSPTATGTSGSINGHKWFISGAKGAKFAILIARTEEDPEIPQAANTAFLVDLPQPGLDRRPRHRRR